MTDAQRIAVLESRVCALATIASRQNDMLLRLTMAILTMHPEVVLPALQDERPVLQ